MSANITIQSEVTEISIEHDVYSDLTVSVEQHKFNDQIKVTINDLAINLDDGIALEMLHSLAQHFNYELIDKEQSQ
ncbi:hypothetical protein F909_03604 [Acinetobacter sp. ANC 3929]|uniref:hypothetical protein n=1 Tax=Acinetobacter sp. ANC 3929 TaxID=1217707 RepID=UPI0002D09085|nr:hypothetical protein [Acinetobacter sp. ANC 3929]ENW78642.1 hypothetical protein F909_03604 [Acinetobacter sp. ANC 3929]